MKNKKHSKKIDKPKAEVYYLAVDDNGLGYLYDEVPVRAEGCWLGVCNTTTIFSDKIAEHLDIDYELTFSNNPRKISREEAIKLVR